MTAKGRFKAAGHKAETCPCVACRVYRGEKPNPSTYTKTARSRSYLWINDTTDQEITNASCELQRSKASIVREAVINWLEGYRKQKG
jgi:hypothetical protein